MTIAALGTLPFLATLWLLVVLGAAVLEESGAKIVAALKGEQKPPLARGQAPIRLRTRPNCVAPMRVNVEWRAAA
jgi:hypothetical protein